MTPPLRLTLSLRWTALLLGFTQSLVPTLAAEPAKDGSPAIPLVIVTVPLALRAGSSNVLEIRGRNLTNVAQVIFPKSPSAVRVEITGRSKAEPPKPLEAAQAGDSKLELRLELPADLPLGELFFTIGGTNGPAPTNSIMIFAPELLQDEKEPNNGFREAGQILIGHTLQGSIQAEKDVDVFTFEGAAGQVINAEVTSAQRHAMLDAILTLYDAGGNVLASNDDSAAGTDAALRVQLPQAGRYYLSVMDAHDRGGPLHLYLLTLREVP